ncbi:unnamed protein product [Adineta steineri]|uniref:Uncharacterized protein n=1 Tax=Adineta steineri TaxID=433720 RepID=A0A814AJS9_9BILA|nr:unnamed protein product [Adineta steineri]CAF1480753.1 unnamed protein product [Adineta steineri]
MDSESTNDSDELIKYLGDRIEEFERALLDDEDFCNKDIDSTYESASKYIKSLEKKFQDKLNELKIKLDQIREENLNKSKQNKKEFDDEIDEVNELFLSGKHQEAKDKLHDYEKHFEQRTTVINTIPKLYTNDIDINRYFSIDKPINILIDNKQDILVNTKQTDLVKKETENLNREEYHRTSFDVRYKRFESQPALTNNNPITKETKSPVSNAPSRSFSISTRLSSPNSKSLPTGDRDLNTPSSVQSNNVNARENISRQMHVRSTPSSPNVIPVLNHRSIVPAKITRVESLTTNLVTQYKHDQNTSLLMACNKTYIILFKSQLNRTTQGNLSAIVRYNKREQNLDWDDDLMVSIGSIDNTNLYILTKSDFVLYSLDSFDKINSWALPNINNHNLISNDTTSGVGTVHNNYVYIISRNNDFHWMLSLFEFKTMIHLYDYNLTQMYSEIKRFIHICVNDTTMSFLVEMNSSQYTVIFCTLDNDSKFEPKKLIQLFYAERPLTICSVYMNTLQKHLFFINDPSAKIIHILTIEKYIQSYSLIANALCYIKDNHELIFVSNDGIHSIKLNEQQNFFSKLRLN